MVVYGFEFVGESWKHNVIFLWHGWIIASCVLLILGIHLQQGLLVSIRQHPSNSPSYGGTTPRTVTAPGDGNFGMRSSGGSYYADVFDHSRVVPPGAYGGYGGREGVYAGGGVYGGRTGSDGFHSDSNPNSLTGSGSDIVPRATQGGGRGERIPSGTRNGKTTDGIPAEGKFCRTDPDDEFTRPREGEYHDGGYEYHVLNDRDWDLLEDVSLEGTIRGRDAGHSTNNTVFPHGRSTNNIVYRPNTIGCISPHEWCGNECLQCLQTGDGANTKIASAMLNTVVMIFFSTFKLISLAMGVCDTEYMVAGFREFGTLKFGFSINIVLLSIAMDIWGTDFLIALRFGQFLVKRKVKPAGGAGPAVGGPAEEAPVVGAPTVGGSGKSLTASIGYVSRETSGRIAADRSGSSIGIPSTGNGLTAIHPADVGGLSGSGVNIRKRIAGQEYNPNKDAKVPPILLKAGGGPRATGSGTSLFNPAGANAERTGGVVDTAAGLPGGGRISNRDPRQSDGLLQRTHSFFPSEKARAPFDLPKTSSTVLPELRLPPAAVPVRSPPREIIHFGGIGHDTDVIAGDTTIKAGNEDEGSDTGADAGIHATGETQSASLPRRARLVPVGGSLCKPGGDDGYTVRSDCDLPKRKRTKSIRRNRSFKSRRDANCGNSTLKAKKSPVLLKSSRVDKLRRIDTSRLARTTEVDKNVEDDEDDEFAEADGRFDLIEVYGNADEFGPDEPPPVPDLLAANRIKPKRLVEKAFQAPIAYTVEGILYYVIDLIGHLAYIIAIVSAYCSGDAKRHRAKRNAERKQAKEGDKFRKWEKKRTEVVPSVAFTVRDTMVRDSLNYENSERDPRETFDQPHLASYHSRRDYSTDRPRLNSDDFYRNNSVNDYRRNSRQDYDNDRNSRSRETLDNRLRETRQDRETMNSRETKPHRESGRKTKQPSPVDQGKLSKYGPNSARETCQLPCETKKTKLLSTDDLFEQVLELERRPPKKSMRWSGGKWIYDNGL